MTPPQLHSATTDYYSMIYDLCLVSHSILFVPGLPYTQWKKCLLWFKPIILAPEAQQKYKKLDVIVLENKNPEKK